MGSRAHMEKTAYGVQLVLERSGRKIAYSQLCVTDAIGRELLARMEVASDFLPKKSPRLAPGGSQRQMLFRFSAGGKVAY